MPQRLKPHTQMRDKRAAARPTASERGYCDKAWFSIRQLVLVRDSYACRACGRVCVGKREAQVDHVLPKRMGGTDEISNLQTLCIRCHSQKTYREGRESHQNLHLPPPPGGP